MSALRPRTADLEWARRAAADALTGTDWVEVGPGREPFALVERDGRQTFRHIPYGAFLPDLVREAAEAAKEAGDLGLLEAIERLFARVEWLVRTRNLLWTPLSPVPALLAQLVEAFGIGPEVHGSDKAQLARLSARLPTWIPRRGHLDAARDLLEAEVPVDPPLRDEVLACRDASWWRARQTGSASPALRISEGFLRFQPAEPAWRLVPEDVLVDWNPEKPLSQGLIRLIPPWSCLRLSTRTHVEEAR